jgi:N-acetylmuramic acid 6-phosphate etherase
MLNTERPSASHLDLDTYTPLQLVNALADDQRQAIEAVRSASASLAQAVTLATERLQRGGRLIYVGAGTSGRLGLLDSVELYPTFSWPRERAVALLAGGPQALQMAVEGAEDDASQGAADMEAARVSEPDVVLLLAASGTTPYTLGALDAARRLGALTLGFANNPDSPLTQRADVGITLDTGAEVISGSTRLKAGTAQKVALNTFSSAVMVRLNKVYGNLMVDVVPTNAKLNQRCVRLTVLATGCAEAQARDTLQACHYSVKTAIVAIRRQLDVGQAQALLQQCQGNVRTALAP